MAKKTKTKKHYSVVHPKGNQKYIRRKHGISKTGKQKYQRVRVYEKMPKGWKVSQNVTTNPKGYKLIDNNKSLFSGKRKTAYIKVKE